jgi:hypothetical protein
MMAKAKSGKKTMGIWGIVCNMVISACLLMSLIQSQEAYGETKKVSGTFKLGIDVAQDTIYLPGKTPVRVYCRLYVLNSTDPDWNNASLFYVSLHIDPTGLGQDYYDYAVITHPDGEKTFIKSEGTWKWKPGEIASKWYFEEKGRFIMVQANLKGLWRPSGSLREKGRCQMR